MCINFEKVATKNKQMHWSHHSPVKRSTVIGSRHSPAIRFDCDWFLNSFIEVTEQQPHIHAGLTLYSLPPQKISVHIKLKILPLYDLVYKLYYIPVSIRWCNPYAYYYIHSIISWCKNCSWGRGEPPEERTRASVRAYEDVIVRACRREGESSCASVWRRNCESL